MSLKLEVGKKYLDNQGREWEVSDFEFASGLYTIKRDSGTINGWTYNNCLPGGRFSMQECLVSEVPATPEFKVGDRVYVCGVGDALPGTVVEVLLKLVNVLIDREPKYTVCCYPSELMLLSDDTTPTYVPCNHIYANQSFMGMDMRCKHCGEKQ